MKEPGKLLHTQEHSVYYRLIALWVLCEAMLGGIIHGFRIPISGLVVGSCAVICICLIAWYVPKKGAILKATLVVAIFKMMLSPQAPVPAYIAVFFQGLLGELLFFNRKFFRISCLLLAMLSLLESGLQRILVLTIVYGNDLWKVVNDFINGLTRQKTASNYSLLIGILYVGLHLVTGILVGIFAGLLPNKINKWSRNREIILLRNLPVEDSSLRTGKRKRLKIGLFLAWVILVALYVQSYFRIGEPLLPASIALKIFIRSLIIVFAWIFIVAPLLKKLLHQWLQKKQAGKQNEIQQVVDLLPSTRAIMTESWKLSSSKKGFKRLILYWKIVLVNALRNDFNSVGNRIIILTGPIGSGKTTSLFNWVSQRNDVNGILTPFINGKRYFKDIESGENFKMEAGDKETNVLKIGKYVFSKKEFERANNIIKNAGVNKEWLIIDEIGPLELKGEGFYDTLAEIISSSKQKIILVIREGLVEKVIEQFSIKEPMIIKNISEIDQRI